MNTIVILISAMIVLLAVPSVTATPPQGPESPLGYPHCPDLIGTGGSPPVFLRHSCWCPMPAADYLVCELAPQVFREV